MHIINKFMMFNMIVKDMPKAKAFYADKLGLKVTTDYRQDDNHWWGSLACLEGGVTITLTTFQANFKPGTMPIYFTTSDIAAANAELRGRGVNVNDIKDDLFGPGSGVKWFNFNDPDGNQLYLVQA